MVNKKALSFCLVLFSACVYSSQSSLSSQGGQSSVPPLVTVDGGDSFSTNVTYVSLGGDDQKSQESKEEDGGCCTIC